MNVLLWIIQILLALLFVFAGVTKLVLPMPDQVHLPVLFFKFIGLCELLGGLGLVLPGLFRTKQFLTTLAAIGLTIIMIGAVVITIAEVGVAAALIPLITGLLCAWIAFARRGTRSLAEAKT